MRVSGWIYWPHFITMLILSLFPREKELQYLELAKTYLECNEPKLSLKCLSYAKEFQLSAQLCERLGKVWPQPKGAPWIMGLHLSKWRGGPSLSACGRKRLQSLKEGEAGPVICDPFFSTCSRVCCMCLCVSVCMCAYPHLCYYSSPEVSHREAKSQTQTRWMLKYSSFLFASVHSLESLEQVVCCMYTWKVFCVSSNYLDHHGLILQSCATTW